MKWTHVWPTAALIACLAVMVGGLVVALVAAGGDDGDRPEARATATAVARPTAEPAFVRGSTLGLRCSTASAFLRERYDLDEGSGCVILRVDGRSGAEHAGLRLGDKIVAVNGVPITSGRQFTHVFERQGAPQVQLKIERAGTTMTVDVPLGRYAEPPADDPYADYLVARGNSDEETAIEYFSRQIERDPGFDLAYAYRAEALLDSSLPGDAALVRAEADLREALRIDPTLAEAHEIYAMVAATNGRYDDALAHIERASAAAGCTPPIASSDVDCGEILMSRSTIYLWRNAPGDVQLIRQDVGTVATVEAVQRRAAGIASQADSNELEARRGAGRCVNDWDIVIPCALWLGEGSWNLEAVQAAEATDRLILGNLPDERMQESHFHLAQMIANRGGDLTEVIGQLNFAWEDAWCDAASESEQCARYLFARAQTYYVRNAPGDMERAAADFRAVLESAQYHDEAARSLRFIEPGEASP